MSDFKEAEIKDALVLDKDNNLMKTSFLITAKADNKVNTMTAAWFSIGNIWSMSVFIIMVKKSRYTHLFLEKSKTFSISFLDDLNSIKLGYLGTVSGRDEDKISRADLHLSFINDTPFIEESKQVIICTKLYENDCNTDRILSDSIIKKYYSGANQGNYHTLYIGRIDKVLNRN